ncbi:hypothetical protein AAFF_G00086200 [Aldrovandia affinis]|uniref:Uncharacterized protein n=1 Tax=Aldrovandia affinis TaxID=143900 RepID=A0AAD7RWR2_9TELE|nr:hypothetical protein AAFF_G00086200 [Aldrovandia affinis]
MLGVCLCPPPGRAALGDSLRSWQGEPACVGTSDAQSAGIISTRSGTMGRAGPGGVRSNQATERREAERHARKRHLSRSTTLETECHDRRARSDWLNTSARQKPLGHGLGGWC